MLVCMGKVHPNKSWSEEYYYCDTDNLEDEDYAEFIKLWNNGEKMKARRLLEEKIGNK